MFHNSVCALYLGVSWAQSLCTISLNPVLNLFCHLLLNVFAWKLNKMGHHFPLSSVQAQDVWRELSVVSLTHIKINGVCSSGGITTHSFGQAGFTIVRSRGNLIRNNSLVFGSIKPLYSNLNFRPTDCLVCLLL